MTALCADWNGHVDQLDLVWLREQGLEAPGRAACGCPVPAMSDYDYEWWGELARLLRAEGRLS